MKDIQTVKDAIQSDDLDQKASIYTLAMIGVIGHLPNHKDTIPNILNHWKAVAPVNGNHAFWYRQPEMNQYQYVSYCYLWISAPDCVWLIQDPMMVMSIIQNVHNYGDPKNIVDYYEEKKRRNPNAPRY